MALSFRQLLSLTWSLPLLTVLFISVVAQAPVSRRAAGDLPRTTDGKPDFTGIWQAVNTAAWNIQDHSSEDGVPAGQGVVVGNEVPYQPWAVEKKKTNFGSRTTADPEARCYLPGVPRAMYLPFPFEIVQTRTDVVMGFEYANAVRYIRMNSKHPDGRLNFWMGDSRGRWEGDTLVVDVTDFTDETWFDRSGNFHSDALHLVERFTPVTHDHIDYEVTIEDSKVFTRPWTMRMPLYRRIEKNLQLLEYTCAEFIQQREYVQKAVASR